MDLGHSRKVSVRLTLHKVSSKIKLIDISYRQVCRNPSIVVFSMTDHGKITKNLPTLTKFDLPNSTILLTLTLHPPPPSSTFNHRASLSLQTPHTLSSFLSPRFLLLLLSFLSLSLQPNPKPTTSLC
ncbi:hypothetical protein RIF29_19619 [Crotalaria pallida]|uniref:Uncharacterized protein n=1 Tax=Crotalaria pallida TaxID=3830 RepID=A0AAN9EZR6_CROPI